MISRLPRTNLTQECLKRIRSYISEHGLRAGDRLPTLQEWSTELGVSMVVVREAFTALRALGLVEIHQGRGIFLRGLQDTSFIDYLALSHNLEGFQQLEVIEARAMLELSTLELCIARATDSDIAELESIIPLFATANPQDGSYDAVHRLFHQTMLRITHNRLLMSVGMPLLNTYWILGNSGAFDIVYPTHQEMLTDHVLYVEAVRLRDRAHSRELVDHHLFNLCSRHGIFPFAEPSSELAQSVAFASQ